MHLRYRCSVKALPHERGVSHPRADERAALQGLTVDWLFFSSFTSTCQLSTRASLPRNEVGCLRWVLRQPATNGDERLEEEETEEGLEEEEEDEEQLS